MSDDKAGAADGFRFIVHDGPKVPQGYRTIIRKQAMKDVGLARKQRSKRQANGSNSRTDPQSSIGAGTDTSFTSETASSSGSSLLHESDDEEVDQTENAGTIARVQNAFEEEKLRAVLATLSFNPEYEAVRTKFGIDVTELSLLTGFTINKSAINPALDDRMKMTSIMGFKMWSYLDFVPSRYGISECLTAATDCLLARVHNLLVPNLTSACYAVCNKLYGRALLSLQAAIASGTTSTEADVLCSTQLLSLYELLDSDRSSGWSQHIQGAAHLIRHRSPSRFQTEFEKALFASHVGAVTSEALVHDTPCYLDSPEWISLYASLTQDSTFLTDRHPLAISARSAMFKIPGVWHDVGRAVNSDDLFDDDLWQLLGLRTKEVHRSLLDWMEDYKAHCVQTSFTHPTAMELALRRELFGTVLQCLIIAKRLVATMYDADRPSLELETLALSRLMVDMQDQPAPKHLWLLTSHEIGLCITIDMTHEKWEEDIRDQDIIIQKLATRQRYQSWCNLLRGG